MPRAVRALYAAITPGGADQAAQRLLDHTMLRSMRATERGVELELAPPREIVAALAHAARGMLGDAPNYSETTMEFTDQPAAGPLHALVIPV